jgi:mono/diheme cytochrome c family protein
MAKFSGVSGAMVMAAVGIMWVSGAAEAGDARQGAIIARRWCAACHVVDPDQLSAFADAPSFSDIALRRTDRRQLANFLADPHPPMPDMHLSRKEIDDIVTYIRSLDPRPAPSGEPEGKDAPPPGRG